MAVVAMHSANAGSAVAKDGHGHTIYSEGQPTKAIAIQHALESARSHGWAEARIIAASDVTVYCAIAVARKGNSSVLETVLRRPSRADAERQAIEICLKGGRDRSQSSMGVARIISLALLSMAKRHSCPRRSETGQPYKNRRLNLPEKVLASFDPQLRTWYQTSCTRVRK
jgi:hypothetical protein